MKWEIIIIKNNVLVYSIKVIWFSFTSYYVEIYKKQYFYIGPI